MSSKSKRTHDRAIYLKDDRYDKPKEIFKRLAQLVRESKRPLAGAKLCDMGCASGEFLYYLLSQFPECSYLGIDAVPELVEKARSKVPGAEFQVGSVLDPKCLPAASQDVIFMQGVLSIFDEYQLILDNLLDWLKPGGSIFIFGAFNPHPADVYVRYRLSDDPDPDHREPGWNLFSKASISKHLDQKARPPEHRYLPFDMPFDLEPNPEDPIRSWTFFTGGGEKRLWTNGLSLLLNLEILEITP